MKVCNDVGFSQTSVTIATMTKYPRNFSKIFIKFHTAEKKNKYNHVNNSQITVKTIQCV